MTDYSYYSEDYFQNGNKCGTAYVNYKGNARSSPLYRGIAETLFSIFQPKNALEIGCATGIVVKRLNALGVDAHGVDVSEWAIRNREHKKVILAAVEKLPYKDSQFDLVYSIHSLEHIPESLSVKAFAEIRRVTKWHQLHMLPLIGTPPYDGNREAVVAGLKKDPTHNLLHDREWWTERLSNQDFVTNDFRVIWPSDTDSFELATCQIILSRRPERSGLQLARAVDQNNIHVARMMHQQLASIKKSQYEIGCGSSAMLAKGLSPLLSSTEVWSDLGTSFSVPRDLSAATLELLIIATTNSGGMLPMRLALICESGADMTVYEKWLEIKPGVSTLKLSSTDFTRLSGRHKLSSVNRLAFGGQSKGSCQILLSLDGEAIEGWKVEGA